MSHKARVAKRQRRQFSRHARDVEQRVYVTYHMGPDLVKLLTNPEPNEGESRQAWKERTFIQRYGTGAGFFVLKDRDAPTAT